MINVYDKELVHRFELVPKGKNMKICQTAISDTKDLFALVYMDSKYHLFMLNLDNYNVRKFHGKDGDLNKLYKVDPPILIFDSIKGKQLTQMHVRGSSKKEAINFNNKLVVIFLFEDSLYMWI